MRLEVLAFALPCLLALSPALAGTPKRVYPPDTTAIEPGQQLENQPGWYDDAIIYQVWVRAFADGLYDDGIGDLPGLQGKLDYLQDLGVNTLWLSPIFQCAYKGANMHGYDTTDYYALNERFGRKADLKNLIDAVHARGMRILFDFVPNHTSTSHPWFTQAATQRSWYVWKTALPEGWARPWGGGDPDDVWKEMDGHFFYSAFSTSSMADLNFYNPEVVTAMKDVERYWLDRGFDGMRVDAVRYLCETGPRQAADQPDTHARLREFRAVLEEYGSGDRHPHPGQDPLKHSVKMMIAEAWTPDVDGVIPYFGNGRDEFNLCLDFSAPKAIHGALVHRDATELTSLWAYERDHFPPGARSATFDSNHDNVISRPASQFLGDRPRIILAEALNLLAPGTPILYYGNEVGMTGAAGSDLDLRSPMDWAAVATQSGQPDSILSWCKYLIKARNTYPALRGAFSTLATNVGPAKAIAYLREAGDERVVVVANLTGETQTVVLTDLTAHGVAPGAALQPIHGEAPGRATLKGTRYAVEHLPPFGVRVLYAAGKGYQGKLHGDLR